MNPRVVLAAYIWTMFMVDQFEKRGYPFVLWVFPPIIDHNGKRVQ